MEAKTATLLAGVLDLLLDAVCIVDADGCFVYVSAAGERIFGYNPSSMIGRPMIELVAPEDRERTLQAAADIMSGKPRLNFENRYIRKDGSIVHILWSARWSEADRLRIAVARDITARKRAELMQAALYSISEAAYAADDLPGMFRLIHQIVSGLLQTSIFAVAMVDTPGGPLGLSYYADRHGASAESADRRVGELCGEIIRAGQPLLLPGACPGRNNDAGGDKASDALCWLGAPLRSHHGIIGAVLLRSGGGSAPYTDQDKELLQFVCTQIATAVERKQLIMRLQYMARYDELTGLPNRGLLSDRLDTALARTQRERGRMALLYLDLDGFKQVNDSLGHAAGDLLLQEVARRLTQSLRKQDTVARMGGDEFVVLLENILTPEHAAAVADKLRSAIGQPVMIDGRQLHITPSVGIALYPEHGADARALIQHADQAMFAAKKNK